MSEFSFFKDYLYIYIYNFLLTSSYNIIYGKDSLCIKFKLFNQYKYIKII